MLEKQNLLGLTQSKLKKFFSDLNEKPFRTKQIMQWIYHQGVTDFDDMHNFSKDLRQKLDSIASINMPEIVSLNHSKDGVVKVYSYLKRIEGLCVSLRRLDVHWLVLSVQLAIRALIVTSKITRSSLKSC